jgi:hypothetical protein
VQGWSTSKLKVHFAGEGGAPLGPTLGLLKSGVKYRLQSYYDIYKRNAIFNIGDVNKFNHTIIDSGLFTLMFGSESQSNITEGFIDEWQNLYINFINKTPFKNASFVECDVQKKISPEYAWEKREEMKRLVNRGEIINVYHLEDGNPDKLIHYSDYIAISIPELRLNVSNKERYDITKYIATKAMSKGKKVHLLGCTEKKYLKDFSYCYSCDSTAWQSAFRYGWSKTDAFGKIPMKQIRSAVNGEVDPMNDIYWSSYFSLKDYETYAGCQN